MLNCRITVKTGRFARPMLAKLKTESELRTRTTASITVTFSTHTRASTETVVSTTQAFGNRKRSQTVVKSTTVLTGLLRRGQEFLAELKELKETSKA